MNQRMLSYSIWARKHQSAAVTLIVIFKILIAVLAFSLGFMVNIWGFALSASFKWLFAAAGAATLVSYPTIDRNAFLGWESYYVKQKRTDFLLACLGGVLWFWVGNQTVQWASQPALVEARVSTVPYVESSLATPHQETPKQSWGLKKIVQHKLKKQIEKIKAREHNSDAGWIILKFLLSLLTVGLVALLGYYVTVLACYIACAGGEALAVLFLALGWVSLLVGTVYTLKSIWHKWGRWDKSAG